MAGRKDEFRYLTQATNCRKLAAVDAHLDWKKKTKEDIEIDGVSIVSKHL